MASYVSDLGGYARDIFLPTIGTIPDMLESSFFEVLCITPSGYAKGGLCVSGVVMHKTLQYKFWFEIFRKGKQAFQDVCAFI